jgi:hydroxymethylpyrimidine pyrophosphatase-like HAD family hydrolase
MPPPRLSPLADWPLPARGKIVGVFTDIDDTLTTHGAITPDALQALADLKAAGLHVIPITGRNIGWCEPLAVGNAQTGAAPWPLDAMVAENGALAYAPDSAPDSKLGFLNQNGLQPPSDMRKPLSKRYQQDAAARIANQARMAEVALRVEHALPGVLRSRDVGGRETDLSFDYAEFNLLPPETVQQVVAMLQAEGMYTTVSSIHIHGCFERFDKWQGACWIVRELLGRDLAQELDRWVFVGDSGNDQAMFEHFTHSVGVANIAHFVPQLTHLPQYVTPSERGAGFAEVARAILQARQP